MTASLEASAAPQRYSHDQLLAIARRFAGRRPVIDVHPLGNGNINDTFRISLDHPAEPYFVLQRINTAVFPNPCQVMQNMCRFTEHVQQRLLEQPMPEGRRWVVPRVIYTTAGQNHWQEEAGGFWRGISFIENAKTFDTLQSTAQAWEVGYGLGMFHQLISDLPPDTMADTLEGFHITPNYLSAYEQTINNNPITENPEVLWCTQFIKLRAEHVNVLENAKSSGKLPVRLIHGDPKINNILFDGDAQQAISLIDLDTVKPGLVQYDIGDCLRSGCNPLGEESSHWENTTFDIDACEGILQGYYDAAKNFLEAADLDYFYDSVWLITFELGLRFFSDYLSGDVYFKTRYDNHNLIRALVQFKLLERIEGYRDRIFAIVERLPA
ncbi:MAG: aminoglycoside phosphotransferase family protein [Cyanobacteria bacterium J06632_22]